MFKVVLYAIPLALLNPGKPRDKTRVFPLSANRP